MDKLAAHAGERAVPGALWYLLREDVVPVLKGLALAVLCVADDSVQPRD